MFTHAKRAKWRTTFPNNMFAFNSLIMKSTLCYTYRRQSEVLIHLKTASDLNSSSTGNKIGN